MRATLRPDERIRTRPDFKRVYEQGSRVAGRYLTVLLRPNEGSTSRLGIVASRKLGGAVKRNRAKRLIREVFRRNKPPEGLDLVIIARSELLDASITSLEADYRTALARLRRGVARNRPQPSRADRAGVD